MLQRHCWERGHEQWSNFEPHESSFSDPLPKRPPLLTSRRPVRTARKRGPQTHLPDVSLYVGMFCALCVSMSRRRSTSICFSLARAAYDYGPLSGLLQDWLRRQLQCLNTAKICRCSTSLDLRTHLVLLCVGALMWLAVLRAFVPVQLYVGGKAGWPTADRTCLTRLLPLATYFAVRRIS